MRAFLKHSTVLVAFVTLLTAIPAGASGRSNGAINEPVLSALSGSEVLIPNTDPVIDGVQANVVGDIVSENARGALSLTGHEISVVESPNDGMREALKELVDAADDDDQTAMTAAAAELESILLGTTEGRIYDGFPMLNFNGPDNPDQVEGDYKTKRLRDSGRTGISTDGEQHTIWELDVTMLWYDSQFDADTFLYVVPIEADGLDLLQINYRIASLVREDFSPATVLTDNGSGDSVALPYKGLDSVWSAVKSDTITEISVAHPPLGFMRGVYTWGWREHPGRVQFLQPVAEIVNAHTGLVELNPQGRSFAERNRALSIDDIGEAAPEKKMYEVASAVLAGASTDDVLEMLTEADTAPSGTWDEWEDLADNPTQLPPEARDILAAEGIDDDEFGPYRFVAVFLNQEMYGDGPEGANRIADFAQGETFDVKVINLDNNTHYFRNVDFGAKLSDDVASLGGAGSHSFEVFNYKPTYGAPKVAEMQWRAGWGFRPHFDVIQQDDVFPRAADQALLTPYTDGAGGTHTGYQYSPEARGGDFRFNPPPFIIGSMAHPSAQLLQEADGSDGLVIGQTTEGYGVAHMCSGGPGFCQNDLSGLHPGGAKNMDTDGDGVPDVLWFPPFLRNPNPDGGDIIPPTAAWDPFLYINPDNGSLLIDPADPSQGYWTDLTFAHGAPVFGADSISATVEAPRAAGQIFYQFDDLFHDNAIFSPHVG